MGWEGISTSLDHWSTKGVFVTLPVNFSSEDYLSDFIIIKFRLLFVILVLFYLLLYEINSYSI